MLISICKGFSAGRFLGYQLFIRDLKASVRQSFLGFFWHFIPAIATAAIWIVLNNQRVVAVSLAPMKYPAFAITGTILWTIFTESVTKPLMRFNAVKPTMTKLNFPREAVIIASLYDIIFSVILKLIILIPSLMLMGYMPTVNWLYALTGIFPLMILSLSLGLLLVPIGMLYMDISKGITIIFQVLMYLSPAVFPLQRSGLMGFIHKINPVTPFLEFIRSNLGGYAFTLYPSLLLWSAIGIFLLLLSVIIVKISLSAILERSGT